MFYRLIFILQYSVFLFHAYKRGISQFWGSYGRSALTSYCKLLEIGLIRNFWSVFQKFRYCGNIHKHDLYLEDIVKKEGWELRISVQLYETLIYSVSIKLHFYTNNVWTARLSVIKVGLSITELRYANHWNRLQRHLAENWSVKFISRKQKEMWKNVYKKWVCHRFSTKKHILGINQEKNN